MKYQVIVTTASARSVRLLRALRLTGAGLRASVELAAYLAENADCTLLSGVDLVIAEQIACALREAGATATIQKSSSMTPMLCTPQLRLQRRWTWFRRLRSDAIVERSA